MKDECGTTLREGARVKTLYGDGTVRAAQPPLCKVVLDKYAHIKGKRTKVYTCKIADVRKL